MIHAVRGSIDSVLNSRDRDLRHMGQGLLLAAGAFVVSSALARFASMEFKEEHGREDEDGTIKAPFSAIWPPLFMALCASAVRVWNAPAGRERKAALTLWSVVQGLNLAWMVLGPRRFGGSTGAQIASAAASLLYLRTLERVDHRAAAWVSPFVGMRSIYNPLIKTAGKTAVQRVRSGRTAP